MLKRQIAQFKVLMIVENMFIAFMIKFKNALIINNFVNNSQMIN